MGDEKILPGLYVGNFRDSKDKEQLQTNNITHVISIHDNAKQLHKDLKYLCILASDTPGQNLHQFFPTCNDFIHDARLNGGSVLIHCLAGVSRSVTITAAYIMSTTGLNYRDALNVVRGARQVANPNYGFQRQLYDFERSKLHEERLRIRDAFPQHKIHDEEACRKSLLAYHSASRAVHKTYDTTASTTKDIPGSGGSGARLINQENSCSRGESSSGETSRRGLPSSPRRSPRASPRFSPRPPFHRYATDSKRHKS